VDDKKVKRLSVNTLMRNKLSSGSLAIVRHGGGYEVIPREAALKIQERDSARIVQLNPHRSCRMPMIRTPLTRSLMI
jgi:uncharacterized protein